MKFDANDLPFLIVHGSIVWKLLLAGAIAIVSALVWAVRHVMVRRRRDQETARQPAATVRGKLVAMVVVAGLAGVIGWKIEAALGESWLRACHATRKFRTGFDPLPFEDAPIDTHACELAAAMPGSRDDAMQAMLSSLDEHPYRDEATVRRIYALADLVEGCDGLRDRLLRDARYDEAVAAARRCGNRRTEHLALRYAGKFEEAVAVAVPEERVDDQRLRALPDAEEWILTNHWKEAAAAASARADSLRSSQHQPDEQASADMTALHYQCLAALFRHHAGDPAAAEQLRTLARRAHGGVCMPALTEIATGDERRALLAQDWNDVLAETTTLRDQLRWAEGLPTMRMEVASAEVMLADPDGSIARMSSSADIWLAATAPPTAKPSNGLLRWSTVAQVLAGDLDRATATAKAAATAAVRDSFQSLTAERNQLRADLEALKQSIGKVDHSRDPKRTAEIDAQLTALEKRQGELEKRTQLSGEPDVGIATVQERMNARFAPLLPALVALRTPQTSLPIDPAAGDLGKSDTWAFQFGPLWLRNGDSQMEVMLSDRLASSLKAAGAGDGLALAAMIRNTSFAEWTDSQVMAVLPRIRTSRDVAIRQLVWSSPPHNPLDQDGVFPWRRALKAATRRDMFRIAGATEMAARWDAIFRRYDQALRDHRRLVALLLWQLRGRYE